MAGYDSRIAESTVVLKPFPAKVLVLVIRPQPTCSIRDGLESNIEGSVIPHALSGERDQPELARLASR
jgi:hypothetical protein